MTYHEDFITSEVAESLAQNALDNVTKEPETIKASPKSALLDMAPKNGRKEGKPRISLIPMDVLAEFVVSAYEEGCAKYKRESWRKGFLISDLMDSCQRHLTDFFYRCEDLDPDPMAAKHKKHHLGGAIFSLLAILWTLKVRPDLDDRPGKKCPVQGSGDIGRAL